MLTLVMVVPELELPGVTWDEPEYFASVERIQVWTATLISDPRRAFDPAVIRAAWDPPEFRYFNPHPPVYKEGMAVTEYLFGAYLGPVSGYRLFSSILFAVLVGLLAWTVSGAAGIVGGIGAALALLLMPRVFGHAHIAATDMPLTCFWAFSTMPLRRSINKLEMSYGRHSSMQSRLHFRLPTVSMANNTLQS